MALLSFGRSHWQDAESKSSERKSLRANNANLCCEQKYLKAGRSSNIFNSTFRNMAGILNFLCSFPLDFRNDLEPSEISSLC